MLTIYTGGMNDATNSAKANQSVALAAEFRRGVLLLGRRLRHEKTSDDVSNAQMSVLGLLVRRGPMSPTDLAKCEHVKPPTMTRLVSRLESMGYVTRSDDERDGRATIIAATTRGHAVVVETRELRARWLAARMNDLAPHEREAIEAVLPVFTRLIESQPSGVQPQP